MTEMEKLNAGEIFDYTDPEVNARKIAAMRACRKFNAIDQTDPAAVERGLHELFGSAGKGVWAADSLSCDCGKNIHVGDDVTINYHVTILDIREVNIGNHVMIGPGTLITTVGHPLSPEGRRHHGGFAKPVNIGNDVWIGGNVVILPGITIGNNVVVGAGAVVTKDIPSNSVALGVPAKVVKTIPDDTL